MWNWTAFDRPQLWLDGSWPISLKLSKRWVNKRIKFNKSREGAKWWPTSGAMRNKSSIFSSSLSNSTNPGQCSMVIWLNNPIYTPKSPVHNFERLFVNQSNKLTRIICHRSPRTRWGFPFAKSSASMLTILHPMLSAELSASVKFSFRV